MNSVQVDTTQNISLDFQLGSLGDRILGRLLDGAIMVGYIILTVIVMFSLMDFKANNNSTWLFIILLLPIVFYDLVCEITLNGQSIGKRALHIKVMSADGNRPTLGQYLIRWLFRLIDFTISQSFCALICVAVSAKHQRLGDMVAGTVVVKVNPPVVLNETLYTPVSDDYEVRFPEAVHLKDEDIQLIKEVLLHHTRQYNPLLLENTADKIKDLLHIQMTMDPYLFLQTIIADYNYLNSSI